MVPSIDWATNGHVDPVKHPETHNPIECSNFLRIENGTFVPVFATAAKPYVCIDERTTTVPDNPPTRNFVNG